MSTTATQLSGRARAGHSPARRADGRRNRQLLAAAAGDLLRRGAHFTLADVAAEADLSTATAYRHFRSADDAIDGFVGGYWDDLDQRVAAAGPDLDLRRLCGIWVQAVLEWGPALVQLRSRDGFLTRRARDDGRVERLVRIVEAPLMAEVFGSGRAPTREEKCYALGMWNAMADPREILDQHEELGWGQRRIAERLHASTLGALSAA